MKQVGTRYWIELSVITLLLAAAAWGVFTFLLPGLYPPVLPFLLATIVVITAAGQVILTRLMREKFSKFNSAFMIYKAVKILILMVFMIIYATLNRNRALPFLGSTLVIYLVFMFFEAAALNRESRKQAER